MGAQGTTTVNFGAFPGTSDATATVTGQASILAGSLVEAWIWPVATADHSIDEHVVEELTILARDVVAATGFTIQVVHRPSLGDTLIYGSWTVAWCWN